MMIKGCDISYWQGAVNFTKMKQACDFVIMRGYFSATKDTRFDGYYPAAGDAGLLRGVYQFVDYRQSGASQASYLVSLYKSKPTEIQPVCDFEQYSAFGSYNRTSALNFLEPYGNRIKTDTGRKTLLYINLSTAQMLAPLPDWLLQLFDLWIAHWTTANAPSIGPFPTWKVWQTGSHGIGANYGVSSANIDEDYYKGTLAELRTWCGLDNPQPPPPPTDDLAEMVARHEESIKAYNAVLNSYGDRLAALELLAAELKTGVSALRGRIEKLEAWKNTPL